MAADTGGHSRERCGGCWNRRQRVALSDWADAHRRLSSEANTSAGPWRTLPFQRGPLDAISPGSPWETVVLVWASQMGKSELLLSLITYVIAVEPGPMLTVQPTLSMVEAFGKGPHRAVVAGHSRTPK